MNETNLNRDDRDVRTAALDREDDTRARDRDRERTAAPTEQGEIPSSRQQPEAHSFLPDARMTSLRKEWEDVQAGFVDDPQSAVQKANRLVDELVDELTTTFTNERTNLEGQWSGGNVDTEALRIALQRYRAFFNRLLDR